MYFRKNTLKKYYLQESYNNFKIKLKISFVNRAPGLWFKSIVFHFSSKKCLLFVLLLWKLLFVLLLWKPG